jgi:hypothetical protein
MQQHLGMIHEQPEPNYLGTHKTDTHITLAQFAQTIKWDSTQQHHLSSPKKT